MKDEKLFPGQNRTKISDLPPREIALSADELGEVFGGHAVPESPDGDVLTVRAPTSTSVSGFTTGGLPDLGMPPDISSQLAGLSGSISSGSTSGGKPVGG